MNITNNVLELNYQNWKNSINSIILYKYFRDKAKESNEPLIKRIKEIENLEIKTPEHSEEYMKLLNQLFSNSANIYKKVEENINNQELLSELHNNKNIDLSIESYNRWLKTGEKFKI